MKSRHCLPLLGWSLSAPFVPGCACAHNRPIVYPDRRHAPIQADSVPRRRGRSPSQVVTAPAARLDQNPQRIDVPMVDPD